MSTFSPKALFIDRDGVLNDLVDRGDTFSFEGKPIRWTAPFHLHEVRLKPHAEEALKLIEAKGYLRIIVTNQPDVATGHIDPEEFERMMDVFRALRVTEVRACKHHPKDGCFCRKPRPGMLLSVADFYNVDLFRSFMVGDMETDIQAGKAASVQTILVENPPDVPSGADHRFANILEVAKWLP